MNTVRVGVLLGAIVLAGCSQAAQDLTAPSSVLSQPTVNASEPPYGQERYLGHAGQIWFGVVPVNPCNVGPWTGHGHSATEFYDPFTEEFAFWLCEGGQQHSEGSPVSILD